METTLPVPKTFPIARFSGAAFALGNLLFLGNKVNEMSRLFLGRYMADVISGEDRLLIAFGQVLLIAGYIGFLKTYAPPSKFARITFRLFGWGGMIVAVGHTSFMNGMPHALFFVVILGMLVMVPGLILFGTSNLRSPIITRWKWLPLFTGLMGFIGFFLFSGENITSTFLFFRTLFALGLVGMGLGLSLEESDQRDEKRLNKLFRWLIATTIGFTVTGVLFHFPSGFPSNNFNTYNGGAAIFGTLMGAVTGVIIGVIQWIFLCQDLPRLGRWIGASAAAYGLIHGIGDSLPDPLALTTVSVIGGLALSGFYWLAGQKEYVWLGANIVGWFLAVQVAMQLSKTDHIIFGAVAGIVYGIVSGFFIPGNEVSKETVL